MSDLISRSALMQSLRGNVLVDVTPNLEQAIAEQPTAYNVDKVVERLEKQKSGLTTWSEDEAYKLGTEKAIEIVKSGGIE